MRNYSLGLFGILLVGCASGVKRESEPSVRRQVASVQDARIVFSFVSEGTIRRSSFVRCLNGTHAVSLAQFAVVLGPGGHARRDDYEGIAGTFPCPKLVQSERNMGWNVASLSRFRQDEKSFQCEYTVRGDTYVCDVQLPTNEGTPAP